jgi:hypothetical protein
MNIYEMVTPYWGIRNSLAIGNTFLVKGFLAQEELREADKLQLICDYFWTESLDSDFVSLLKGKKIQREVFWLSELYHHEADVPFNEGDLIIPVSGMISLKLKRSLAIRDWCIREKSYRKDMRKKVIHASPTHSLEYLVSPYDPTMTSLFKAAVPEEYTDRIDEIKLLWYYLINENGGIVSWNLLTKRIGISIQSLEWSEIRTRIKRNLLALLEPQIPKSG